MNVFVLTMVCMVPASLLASPETPAPAELLAAYQVSIRLSPTKAATSDAAFMVYLPIVIGPAPKVGPTPNPQPSTPFGVQPTLSLASGNWLSRIADLRSSWVRLADRISWRALQPNQGDPIHWKLLADFAAELRALKQAGITPVVVINDAPRWAAILPTSCGAIRAEMFPEYAQFVRALVARYQTAEYGVHNWELGNEPDVAPMVVPPDNPFGCWGDVKDPFYGGRQYGEMLKVVGPAIKAEDPQARIWTGGLLLDRPDNSDPKVGRPELFLQGILEAGAAPYVDVVAYHVYDYYSEPIVDFDTVEPYFWKPWGGRMVGKARFLRQLMAGYGVDKPLVANEIGLLWCKSGQGCPAPTAKFYQAQADFIVRTLVRGGANRVQGFAWYPLEWPGYRFSSLLFEDGSPKPVYRAYQQLATQLAGTTFLRAIAYGTGIEAYAFGRAAEQVQVIWTTDVTTRTITIPTSQLLRAVDRDGQPVVPVVDGLNSRLTVGFAPIYVVTH